MQADIHTLYESDFYRILDFRCRCNDCRTSKPEYSQSFAISFVRKGNFLFNVFRHSLDSYTGCVLITKPGYEHTVTHVHTVPDECTIFEFKESFYRELQQQYGSATLFTDNDIHSTLVRSSAELEFYHFYLMQLVSHRGLHKLQADNLVMEMTATVLAGVTDYIPDEKINAQLKKNHLITIEKAKQYMTENFIQDISLMEMATHCHVSPFHFSRLFKTFTSSSPHQFLQAIRLQHAVLLLRNTSMPVADVAFSSGFNSIEYFTAAFRHRYKCPPSKYRVALFLNTVLFLFYHC
ncbi:MAG: AraC family transcriptional regulator [Chitinophagaceae bacterium]